MQDLGRGLRALGFTLHAFVSVRQAPLGGLAATGPWLVRVRFVGRKRGYHWIAVGGGRVHDPEFTRPCSPKVYVRWLRARRAYLTSAAAVRPNQS